MGIKNKVLQLRLALVPLGIGVLAGCGLLGVLGIKTGSVSCEGEGCAESAYTFPGLDKFASNADGTYTLYWPQPPNTDN
jgi:hypothetical protein